MAGERIRVLSVDGGGTRGVIPTLVVDKLEKLTGQPACELFDLIAASSAGALLALGLATPDENGGPRYSAEQLARLSERDQPLMFHTSRAHLVRAAGGVLTHKYEPEGLIEAVQGMTGETMLSESLTELLIPTYAIEERRPIFFKTVKAKADPETYDVPLWVCGRAATAAPTFFPPAKLELGSDEEYLALIDGGVYLNNPAVSAYAEARKMYPEAENIFVLSLGTGQPTAQIRLREATDWGLAQWGRPILDVTNDGGNQAIDYQLRHLLGPENYVRMQPLLGAEHSHLDSFKPDHQRRLRLVGERQLKTHKDVVKRCAEQLVGD